MIDLKALQGQVKLLVDDLRTQAPTDEELWSSLHAEYRAAVQAQRTAGTFETWLEDVLDQAAVAWVLGCVFVRFCEDNALIQRVWLGGPTENAPAERAVQERQGYLIANPLHNDRHWLREAFGYLAGLGATGKIFDRHNPVWRFTISGPAAETLSDFFRRGAGFVSLESPGLNTRFLGDLYQNLSVEAREQFALWQTPEFVEEFILDRTFEPSYREFGLARTSVIDPTCGSGHFLLGAFGRLIARWKERESGTDVRVLVQRTLDQVTGVDVNQVAVAIARFRLMVAAIEACGTRSLESAPAFTLRLATGDSLLGWGRSSTHQGVLDGLHGDGGRFAYFSEDFDELTDYLRPGQYTVVVGNPPYKTVKDKALSSLYRTIYSACHLRYALTVPFAQLFFRLARRGDNNGDGAGHVGQITSNSFMKREFGRKLIDEFLAHDVELTEVVDGSVASIPGHGTPTVVLIGRNRLVSPRYSGPVRALQGVRSEVPPPSNPADGKVWQAILAQIDSPGSSSEWITSVDLDRQALARHPWSMSGGGASALMEHISARSAGLLGDLASEIGITAVTGEDDFYLLPDRSTAARLGIGSVMPLVEGDTCRDHQIRQTALALWPYSEKMEVLDLADVGAGMRRLFQTYRSSINRRRRFGTPMVERGLTWWEWQELYRDKLTSPFSIAYAEVATHNHFAFDRGEKVFKQTAPVIKLAEGSSEVDHIRLLGVLNSSLACFWLKQVSHNKGGPGGGSSKGEKWRDFYQFNSTKLKSFPLPESFPEDLARSMANLVARLADVAPSVVAAAGTPTRQRLAAAKSEWQHLRARMIAVQEELDWSVYHLFGLVGEDYTAAEVPGIRLGERAFEIALARRVAEGNEQTRWFSDFGGEPTLQIPSAWGEAYRDLVQRRIELISADTNIALLERQDCKRPWETPTWEAMQSEALRGWLLDRLEASEVWAGAPAPMSVARLAERVRHDEDFRSVLDLWVGSDQHDLVKTLGKLVATEHVPYLPSLRYKPTGLRKRVQWERTWELQRREDAGEKVEIAVPPKYGSGDFLKSSYWRNRGKLDVPKERFVSYPQAGRDDDPTLLIGWAGWDHLAQAQALATVYLERKNQAGWAREALLPLLAGVAELEPWLKQWHDDERAGFPGGSPARFFTGFIDTELMTLGADRADLTKVRGLS